MSSFFSFFNNDWVITIILTVVVVMGTMTMYQYVEEKNWFSDKFSYSMEWIGTIVFLIILYQGFFLELADEFREALQQTGGIALSFFPFFLGAMIGFFLITIFLTYIFRLIVPIFKYIHDKTNK